MGTGRVGAVAPAAAAVTELPLWLARLHRRLPVGAATTITLRAAQASALPLPIDDVLTGAGFTLLSATPSAGTETPPDATPSAGLGSPDVPAGADSSPGTETPPDATPSAGLGSPGVPAGADSSPDSWEAVVEYRVERGHSLPDWVGPGMRALVVGLNPSPASADRGVNFARPGNRFWPAALAAGLVDTDRDPERALVAAGVGFTDLVKRTTRTAAELSPAEFRDGVRRLGAVVGWLAPDVLVIVGLTGWRAAVDRKAGAGWQEDRLGPSPVYLMPNTSGLNAHSSLDDFTAHFRAAMRGPTSTEQG